MSSAEKQWDVIVLGAGASGLTAAAELSRAGCAVLILEARKSIRTNGELWEYSLTGRIRTQDVAGNNTVATENVADLNIIKREHGKIQDSTKQGILSTLYDKLLPF